MQKAIAAIVVIIILGAGGLALTRNNNKSNQNSTNQSGANNTSQQNPVSANAISLKDMAFSPANITVAKGTKVTWTNNDSITHTVTENDSQTGPDSGALDPGKSYSFTYNQAGTFKYHCTIHPEMTGTVKVTDTSNAAPQASTPSNSTDTSGSTSPPPASPY